MATTVAMPLWLVVVLGVLAATALIDRLLAPALRWWLRRRLNRAIDELNRRLKLTIPPFKLARRRALIEQLLFDPEVLKAVDNEAMARGEPKSLAHARARRYAREIVPAFSHYAYFHIGAGLAKWLSTALYRVRIGVFEEAELYRVPSDAAVVFVINHRSNMDYVLVTYMVSQSSALSYALGEWARVWMLQWLIRAMGGYFVRRDSSSPLYRRVLARYVQMATASGVTQAVFPEGGLTRDGRLRPPKLGLLSYMVSGFDPAGTRDVVFVPVGLNYDRVLEDRVLTSAVEPGSGRRPQFAFNPLVFGAWLCKGLWLRGRGRWHRYGYACVSFGRPVSLRAYLSERGTDLRLLTEEHRFAEIERLGQHLLREVGRVVPALPVSLVASALLAGGEHGLSSLELKGAVYALMARLKDAGAHVHIPRHDQEYALEVGLRMLLLRHLVTVQDGVYRPNCKETVLLAFYANAIAHLLV
ncbi:MAG: 1-acyl-sn-glycerol-3-phosphate acyltransferase [Hyphomicrobiaceae bacterium]|nr:1-acyl-sn-glycerol-3-phosphate acyltransferase [Hyphomicrobiaceae bacterium]